MAVEWTVKSETVHHSKAQWVGVKPKDGGLQFLLETFEWIRENRTPGRLVVHFGTGGSVSSLEFEQREYAVTPEAETDS
ncbi:MAG: hypothetical protein KGL39_19240 [Patescibacteria group bacterium]|nr:hypothetical protein [Patescibacteria group bacterium]